MNFDNGMYAILIGHEVKTCNPMTYARWFEAASQPGPNGLPTARHVAWTQLRDCTVSTVFIGLDHGFSRTGPPLWFETLVEGGALNGEQDRYTTWEQAEAGHAEIVLRIRRHHEP